MLTSDEVKKFKEIYKKNFGEELSDQEALEKGMKLVNLMKAVYGPENKDVPRRV